VNEAEKFSEEDKKKREDVDVRNSADSMAYQTEKQLTELGDKVPEDVKEKVNQKLTELKSAVEGGDIAQMKEAQEALQKEVMEMGQAIYQGSPQPSAGSEEKTSSDPGSAADDVIDAEFSSEK